jgi:hypothetical protein
MAMAGRARRVRAVDCRGILSPRTCATRCPGPTGRPYACAKLCGVAGARGERSAKATGIQTSAKRRDNVSGVTFGKRRSSGMRGDPHRSRVQGGGRRVEGRIDRERDAFRVHLSRAGSRMPVQGARGLREKLHRSEGQPMQNDRRRDMRRQGTWRLFRKRGGRQA